MWGLERQSPVVGGCRGRAGASSPELGQRGGLPSAAEPCRRLQVPLCLGGNKSEKHSVLKGKKNKIETPVVLAIEGFGRLSAPLLVGFLCSILISFPVFWLQFSGNLLSVLQGTR